MKPIDTQAAAIQWNINLNHQGFGEVFSSPP
jgi:hypothetical protein